jgi:hypothetical protein
VKKTWKYLRLTYLEQQHEYAAFYINHRTGEKD